MWLTLRSKGVSRVRSRAGVGLGSLVGLVQDFDSDAILLLELFMELSRGL